MPNESLTLGEESLRRFNAGDLDGFWALVHPECLLVTDPAWPGGGRFEGREAYRRFMGQFLEAFEGIQLETTGEPQEVGDAALLRARWVGSGLASGIETASDEFSIAMVARDGMIGELHFSFSDSYARRIASTLA
jgi:ketosteroid isomerase-like protein